MRSYRAGLSALLNFLSVGLWVLLLMAILRPYRTVLALIRHCEDTLTAQALT